MSGDYITVANSTFTNNTSVSIGGGLLVYGLNCNTFNCNFTGNHVNGLGGAMYFYPRAVNSTLTDSNFIGNTANEAGGGVYWDCANNNMTNCNFKNNYAPKGANLYWTWTVEEFLNKYDQIHDYDYVFILNGVGTPSRTIVLNKKGVIISGQSTNVIFDAKGGNVHFEVTGEGVLIEKITFRNFNFTERGGAILWVGANGILKNCNFFNNTGYSGGALKWYGVNGTLTNSIFIKNNAYASGAGAVGWGGINGILTDCSFSDNSAISYGGAIEVTTRNCKVLNSNFTNNSCNNYAGGVYINNGGGYFGILSNCIFINNTAGVSGGGVSWAGNNGTLNSSTFIDNTAKNNGGGIYWNGANATLSSSIFTNNSANNGGGVCFNAGNSRLSSSIFTNNSANNGGAVYWYGAGSMSNCNFINSKSAEVNGIFAGKDLNINGGEGIVYINTQGTLSGASIVVLNNETYYYPPNTNINLRN